MLLSIPQRYILEALRKVGCIRRRQLCILLQKQFPVSDTAIDAMLRQLRMGAGEIRLDGEFLYLAGTPPEPRRLEAIDVMLALTDGRPQDFAAQRKGSILLRFSYGGDTPRLFTVAVWSHAALSLCGLQGRVIWLSDSPPPVDLILPKRHFWAIRQPDGSYRFYGSNGL